MWVCERCTLNNIERKKRCDACGGERCRKDGTVSRNSRKSNRSSSSSSQPPILNNHENKRLKKNDNNNDISANQPSQNSNISSIQLPNIECNNDAIPLIDRTNLYQKGRSKKSSKQNGMKSDETTSINRIISNDMDVCAPINKCQEEGSSNDMNLTNSSSTNNPISKRKWKSSKISQQQHSVNDNNIESPRTTTWNCIACTYANKVTHRRCHVCSTRRCDDHYTSSEAQVSSSSSISSPSPQELVLKSRPGTTARHLTRKRRLPYQSNHLHESKVDDNSLPPTACENINNKDPLIASLLPTQYSLGTISNSEKNTKNDIRLGLNITGCHKKYKILLAAIETNAVKNEDDENPSTDGKNVDDTCFDTTESLQELDENDENDDDKQDQNSQTELSIILDSTVHDDSSNCLKQQKNYIQHDDDHKHESISDRMTEQDQSQQECIDYAISEEPQLHEIHDIEPIIQILNKDMLISSEYDFSNNKNIIESLVEHSTASGDDHNECDNTFCSDNNSRATKEISTSFDDSLTIQPNEETISERDVDNNHDLLVDNPLSGEDCNDCDDTVCCDNTRATKDSFDHVHDASVSQLLDSSKIHRNVETISERDVNSNNNKSLVDKPLSAADCSDCDDSVCYDNSSRAAIEGPTSFDDVHDTSVSQLLDSSKIQQNVKAIFERDVDNINESLVDNPLSAEECNDCDDTVCCDNYYRATKESPASFDEYVHDTSVSQLLDSSKIQNVEVKSEKLGINSLDSVKQDQSVTVQATHNSIARNVVEISSRDECDNAFPTCFDDVHDRFVSQLLDSSKIRNVKTISELDIGNNHEALIDNPPSAEGYSDFDDTASGDDFRAAKEIPTSFDDGPDASVSQLLESSKIQNVGVKSEKLDVSSYYSMKQDQSVTVHATRNSIARDDLEICSRDESSSPTFVSSFSKCQSDFYANFTQSQDFEDQNQENLEIHFINQILNEKPFEENLDSLVSHNPLTLDAEFADDGDNGSRHCKADKSGYVVQLGSKMRAEDAKTYGLPSLLVGASESKPIDHAMHCRSTSSRILSSIDTNMQPVSSCIKSEFAGTASTEYQNINLIYVEKAPNLLSDQNHQPVRNSISSHSSSEPPSLANFKSAGSNKIVQISKQSMARASKILGASVLDDEGKPEKNQVSGFSIHQPGVTSTEPVGQNAYESRNILESFSHQQLRCDTRSNIPDHTFLGQIPESNEHRKTSKSYMLGVVERETYGTSRSSATDTRSSLSVRESAEWLGKDSSQFLCEENVTTPTYQHCSRTKVAEILVEPWSTLMVPAFKFAGSDRIVHVSEKDIASASRILDIIDADDTGILSRNLPVFCKDPAQRENRFSMGLACHYSLDVVGDKNSESHLDQQINPCGDINHEFVSFKAAGSEKVIQVSEQGMSNASRIMRLSDSSDREATQRQKDFDARRQCADTTSIEHQDTYKTSFEKVPELHSGQYHDPVTDSIFSHSSSVPPFLANFKSAGSNKIVQISEQSMAHASRIMGTIEDDDEHKPEKNQVCGVNSRCPAVTSTDQVFRGRNLDCNKHVKTSKSCLAIGVARETVEIARSAATDTRTSHSARDLAEWLGKDSSHSLCDESVKTISSQNFSVTEAADLPVQSWSTPMVPMFKCAGSDRMVHVSENGLAYAARILSIIDAEDPIVVSRNLAFIDRDQFSVGPSCHYSRDNLWVSKSAESHFDQQIHSVGTLPSSKSSKSTELDETMQVQENRLINASTILGLRNLSVQKVVSQKSCSRSPTFESSMESSTCKSLGTTTASFISNSSFLPPVLASFKSAASDKVIHISEKNLMNAMKILGDGDDGTNITDQYRVGDTHRRCCLSTELGSQFDVDKADKQVAVPTIDRQPQSVSQCVLPILPCVTPTFASFKSPGSGSDNKIMAHQFKSNDSGIQDFSVSRSHERGDNNRASGAHMDVRTSQSSGRSVNEVSYEKNLPSESDKHPYQAFDSLSSFSSCRVPSSAPFKFAGVDAIINLSEQGLANDSRALDIADSDVNETADTNHSNASRMQRPARVSYDGNSLGVSCKPDIKACFDQQPLPSLFAAFQCAGSHKVIHVSEDSMKNVARILEETGLDVKESVDRNISPNSYKRSPFLSIDHTSYKDPKVCVEKSTVTSSGQQSIPSEESNLPISSWPTPLVATFKSAGSDNMIKISELSLTNASKILGFDHTGHADFPEKCETDGDITQVAGVATDPFYQDNLIVTHKKCINKSVDLENNATVFQSTVVQPSARTLPEIYNGTPSSILDGNSAMINNIKGCAGYSPSSGSIHSPTCGSRAALSEDFARCCNSVSRDVKISALQDDTTKKVPGCSEEKNIFGCNELKLDEDTTGVATLWQSPRCAPFDPYASAMPSSAHAYNCYSSPCILNGTGRDCDTESTANNISASITSESASRVTFDSISRKPTAIGSLADSLDNVEKLRSILCDSGCERHKLSDKWLLNHIRWVVWKLACMERYFTSQMEESVLTIERVVRHLFHRYNKEYRNGARSPVRKMLNHDVSASTMIILCVARIENIANVTDMPQNDSECYLELTDGWYSLKALPDLRLCSIIRAGKIRVGTKLLLCNSRLEGDCDGIDPLDDAYDLSLEKGPTLRIFANSTRLAKWNSKLDFIHPGAVPSSHQGKLLVRRLSDVFEDGGNIPLIRLRVRSVGNMMYLEKNHAGASEAQHHRILSEKEETSRFEFLEKEQQHFVEEYSEDVYRDCCEVSLQVSSSGGSCNISESFLFQKNKELDAEAPDEWNQMMKHDSPEDYYEALESRQRKAIDIWREHRFNLLQSRIQKELTSRLEESNAIFQPSTPFLRIEVQDAFAVESGVEESNQVAMLTIWNPSQDQLALFDKNAVLQMKNLELRGERFKGCLQLSANAKTEFSSFSKNKCNTSLFRIQLQSKQIGYDHGKKLSNNLLNFTGIILKSGNARNFLPPCLYATDESGLILRITFESKTLESRSFLDIFTSDELTTQNPDFEILCFSSLQLMPFDYETNCCVAKYGPLSSVTKNAETRRYLILNNYGAQHQGQRALRKLSSYIRCELPYFWRSNARTAVSVGFIVGLSVITNSSSTCMIVEVDCGGPILHKWALPMDLIGHLNSLLDESNINNAILAEHLATNLMSLGKLGQFLRVSQILLQFGLRILDSSSTHEVTSIRRANQENISFLYSW